MELSQPKNSHAIEGVLIEGDMVRTWGIRAKATQDSILLENDVQLSFSVVTFLRDILSILLATFAPATGACFSMIWYFDVRPASKGVYNSGWQVLRTGVIPLFTMD